MEGEGNLCPFLESYGGILPRDVLSIFYGDTDVKVASLPVKEFERERYPRVTPFSSSDYNRYFGFKSQ